MIRAAVLGALAGATVVVVAALGIILMAEADRALWDGEEP